MTHWVTVYVQVPVKTDHPSPIKAEDDAMKVVEAQIKAPLRVSGAMCSRQGR